MNDAPSINLCFAAAEEPCHVNLCRSVQECSALKIHITPEATANSDHLPRCGNCSTGRLWSRTESAQFARRSSRTTPMLYRTTNNAKEWEERGEMTIGTTFKQRTGVQWRERINQNAMIGAYWIRRWLSRRIVQDSVLTQVASNCLHIRFTMGQKYHERKCRKMLEMLSPTTAAVSQPALDFMS